MAAIGASVARTCFEGPRLSVSNSRAIIGWQTRAVKGEAAPLLLFGGVHARPFGKEPQTSSARSALLACLTSGREYNRLLHSLFRARDGVGTYKTNVRRQAGEETPHPAAHGRHPLPSARAIECGASGTLSPRRGLSSAGMSGSASHRRGLSSIGRWAPSPLEGAVKYGYVGQRLPSERAVKYGYVGHRFPGEGRRVWASPRFVLRRANVLRPSGARQQSRKGQVTQPLLSVRCWL